MFPSTTSFIVSAYFINIYHYFTQILTSYFVVIHFVANIIHLFQVSKFTLHVIAGAYIVLMQNSCNVQF